MSNFFVNRKPKMLWVRLSSFCLAYLLFFVFFSTQVYAFDSNNSDPDTSAGSEDIISSAAPTMSGGEEISGSVISLDISAQAALVVGTGRGMKLYSRSEQVLTNYPAASKLMTAVIALEELPLDAQVTISSDAQALDIISEHPLNLSKGEKFSVKYLVTSLIYTNSDAAALSLAEYISSDELSFVKRMNETAKALNMSDTLFTNTSGAALMPASVSSANASAFSSKTLQHTTLSDLSFLFRYALNLEGFREIFSKYKTLMFLTDGTPHTLTSSMSSAWGLNPQLEGAARFEHSDADSLSCVVALASIEDFEIAIVLGGYLEDSVYQDLYKTINTIFSTYEVSDLVAAGDQYRSVSIDGIPDSLPAVFGSTVRYIHPVNSDYIKPNTVFIPSGALSLPISKGQSLGQVRFELEDGTLIDTEVVAAEDLWTRSDFLSDALALLLANRNLSVIIGIACIFFLGSMIRSIFILCFRYRRSRVGQNKSANK